MSNNDRNGHLNVVDVITIFSFSLIQFAPYISDDLTTPYQDHFRIIKPSCAGWLLSFRFSNYAMRILCLLFDYMFVCLCVFFYNVDFFLSPNAIKYELLISQCFFRFFALPLFICHVPFFCLFLFFFFISSIWISASLAYSRIMPPDYLILLSFNFSSNINIFRLRSYVPWDATKLMHRMRNENDAFINKTMILTKQNYNKENIHDN